MVDSPSFCLRMFTYLSSPLSHSPSHSLPPSFPPPRRNEHERYGTHGRLLPSRTRGFRHYPFLSPTLPLLAVPRRDLFTKPHACLPLRPCLARAALCHLLHPSRDKGGCGGKDRRREIVFAIGVIPACGGGGRQQGCN